MQYATREEGEPYLEHHRALLMERVHGLENITTEEDEEGFFARFHIKETPDDSRTMSVEAAAGMMRWQTPALEMGIRIKATVEQN